MRGFKTSAFEIVSHRDVSFFIIMISCFTGHLVIPLLWMAIFGNIISVFDLLKYFDHLDSLFSKNAEEMRLELISPVRKIIETNTPLQAGLLWKGDSKHDKACAEQI